MLDVVRSDVELCGETFWDEIRFDPLICGVSRNPQPRNSPMEVSRVDRATKEERGPPSAVFDLVWGEEGGKGLGANVHRGKPAANTNEEITCYLFWLTSAVNCQVSVNHIAGAGSDSAGGWRLFRRVAVDPSRFLHPISLDRDRKKSD